MNQRFFLSLALAAFLFFATPLHPANAQPFEPNFDDGMAAFNYGDNDLALRHFLPLSNQGDARAQYYLAYMMDSGLGMGKDINGASGWYRKSAMQSYLPAMVYMGYITSAGHGVTKDDKEAFKWYTAAAQMGDPIAQNNLATMLRAGKPYAEDKKLAAQWFLQASMQGNMRAQYNLATMYRLGDGIKKNSAEALKWYTYAANQGDMYAQYALGYMYYTGTKGAGNDMIVPQDWEQAAEWFRRAAEQGHLPAQMALARMYENGEGGPEKGLDDAMVWYLHAGAAGNDKAMRRLGLIYEGKVKDWRDKGVAPDYKEAMKWLKQSAEDKDDYPSMIELGHLYEDPPPGTDIRKDLQKALSWYSRAATEGYGPAMMEMGRLSERGIGMQADKRDAYKWYSLAIRFFKAINDTDDWTEAVKARTMIGPQVTPADRGAADVEVDQWRPVIRQQRPTKENLMYDKG